MPAGLEVQPSRSIKVTYGNALRQARRQLPRNRQNRQRYALAQMQKFYLILVPLHRELIQVVEWTERRMRPYEVVAFLRALGSERPYDDTDDTATDQRVVGN
jgi:hypothetical protein